MSECGCKTGICPKCKGAGSVRLPNGVACCSECEAIGLIVIHCDTHSDAALAAKDERIRTLERQLAEAQRIAAGIRRRIPPSNPSTTPSI